MNIELITKLEELVGRDRVLREAIDMIYASRDQSTNVAPCLPLIVVKVHTIAELVGVSQICLSSRTPLVVRGAGTGKSGGAVPDSSWVVIDILALNRIIDIDEANLTAEVEPGVILSELQAKVKERGLFYPPDPASAAICTIGGNVAENAAGPSTLKYGTTRDYLLGGQAVLGTGELIDFGKRCPKGVSGLDIASILCGSEGTLAVFTKFTLRLLPWPQDHAAALFLFANEQQALEAVPRIFKHGHRPKILEFIDGLCIRALKKQHELAKVNDHIGGALLIECDASSQGGARQELEAIERSLSVTSCQTVWAHGEQEQLEFRRVRASLSEACSRWLGCKISEDIAVPIAKLAEFSAWLRVLVHHSPLNVGLFGHAGDGNLHVQILFEHENERGLAQALRSQVLLQVLHLGGTLSAEHGIGLQKKEFLPLEQCPALINLQKRLKYAFDPYKLLNPGKIFDS